MVQRLILTPTHTDIVLGNGASEGAVDLFSYGMEGELAARALGSLYVVGWRQEDTNTMGYMISLIAALARREYYAQPTQSPRDAFARTLHKINDVVDEFGKSSNVQLAVGIWAITGSTLMASRLDKFKLLLARDGEVIDIFNNVGLFSRDHVEKREFSSVIHGSVQGGDRLLAYWPSKQVTSRERALKALLINSEESVPTQLKALGTKSPSLSASFVYVDITQETQEATAPDIQPPELTPEPEVRPAPAAPEYTAPALAWAPRQQSSAHATSPQSEAAASDTPDEVPHLIPAEFSLGTPSRRLGSIMARLTNVRLDTRGKAIVLVVAALVVAVGVVGAKHIWFVSPQDKALNTAISDARAKLAQAQDLISSHASPQARTLLASALSTLNAQPGVTDSNTAQSVASSLSKAIDELDNAQTGTVSVVAQLDPAIDTVALVTYASSSHTIWAVTTADGATSVVSIVAGTTNTRATLPPMHPDLMLGFQQGVIVMDFSTRSFVRVSGNAAAKPYTIPTQDQIIDATEFNGALYVLTDHGILKITDADTIKPITKQWLTDSSALVAGARRIFVDGNIYLATDSGQLVTYYKGKQSASVQTTVDLSGNWRLLPADEGTLGIANADRMRVYFITISDGSLVRTVKLDSQQSLLLMAPGPDGSTLAVTRDNRIWQLQ